MHRAISPLDGRYRDRLEPLQDYFSEYALMRMRVQVELRYLKALGDTGLFQRFSPQEEADIEGEIRSFDEESYARIKSIEKEINHDVKACELYLRERLPEARINMIHFGLTSEDVNNLAYSILLSSFVRDLQLPLLRTLISTLCDLAAQWKAVPFPARTHGQLASPSTAGKEMAVYIHRLLRRFRGLRTFRFRGKINGATGNYSAWKAAFPAYDWRRFSDSFVSGLNLEVNQVTTQIEDHDSWIDYLLLIRQTNALVLDLDRDIWIYMTLGYLTTSAIHGEVGSSTMPHKVNPINFENSEGNIELSNALIVGLVDKLAASRLQRDLSDSTVTRNLGVALGHAYLAWLETIKGLSKLCLNEARCREELDSRPELLAEPIQTILRREGAGDPYELLKHLTRGRRLTVEELQAFVQGLPVRESVKNELNSLVVAEYVGYAAELCGNVLAEAEAELEKDGSP